MREQFSGSENGTDRTCTSECVAVAFHIVVGSTKERQHVVALKRVGDGPGADEVTAVHHKATHMPAPRATDLGSTKKLDGAQEAGASVMLLRHYATAAKKKKPLKM